MKDDRPSQTAGWVAAWRGLAPWLPEGAQLAQDPFGLAFTPSRLPLTPLIQHAPWLVRALLKRGWLSHMIVWLQLRTRSLDDMLLAFVRGGGRQVVLLGAGFDCRAARFAAELSGVTVFEVDHPATQSRKREVLARLGPPPSARVEYVSWNFERDAMATLGAHLPGHDPSRPTFTIWEGVIPYLTEPAVASSVAAVRAYSCAGSQLAFSYLEPQALAGHGSWQRAVKILGEPWRFGWRADELPAWMAAHGMRLVSDESEAELAARLLPPGTAVRLGKPGRRVGLAEPVH